MTAARILAVAVACLVVVGAPSPAHAQQDMIKLAERLNRKAMEDYDALEFESARTTLLSAIAKLRDAGQDETPTAAKVYVSLGTVYIAGSKDKNRGVQQFVEALQIDGTVALDPERATPELQEAFDEAVKKVGPSKKIRKAAPKPAGEPEGESGTPTSSSIHGLQHASVDEAKAGESVAIRAQLGSDVSASRLFLFYRGGGQEDYVSVPMNVGGNGDWIGTIPADVVQGKTVQYFIEARDNRGRPAIASGSAASPYIISIQSPIVEQPVAVNKNRDNPLEQFRKTNGKEDRGFGHMFINILVGTDLGVQVAGNNTEVAYQYNAANGGKAPFFKPVAVSTSGVASGPLHGTLEIGAYFNRHIGLSLVGRLEGTLINNADSSDPTNTFAAMNPPAYVTKATLAPAGLLRLRYTFGENRFRPSIHLSLGGGLIRHVFNVSSLAGGPALVDQVTADYYNNEPGTTHGDPYLRGVNKVCQDPTNCVDTIAIGYVFTGVGASFYYDVIKFKNGGFGVLLDIAALLGFGGGQFGVNFDIAAGFGAHFL